MRTHFRFRFLIPLALPLLLFAMGVRAHSQHEVFALRDGFAHDAELPQTAGRFGIGFLAATAVLHAGGVLLCARLLRHGRGGLLRPAWSSPV